MSFLINLLELLKDPSKLTESSDAIGLTKLSILDWAAVGIKGSFEPVSKVISRMIIEESGAKEAFAFGLNKRMPARSAALMNGVASHALDYDDTNFLYLGHPSVVVNSAVFAIANKTNLSLSSTIKNALVGYEVAAKLGVWLGREHYQKGFHITATAGVFGAAMGCSGVLNSSKEVTKNALNLAASKASGLKSQFGTMGKPYHAGMAASSGVEVAMLAKYGLIASDNSLEGEYGFGAAYGRKNTLQSDGFGEASWLFTSVKYKFHACCHGTHAAIEALNFLKKTYCFNPKHIKKIWVTVNPKYASVCNIKEPKSGLEIKFSYRMIIAMIIFDYDTSKLDIFSDQVCFDPELIKFRRKVDVNFSKTLKDSESKVEVQLSSNIIYSKCTDLEKMYSFNDLEEKVRKKAQGLLGSCTEKKIWSMIQDKNITSSTFMEFLSECS